MVDKVTLASRLVGPTFHSLFCAAGRIGGMSYRQALLTIGLAAVGLGGL